MSLSTQQSTLSDLPLTPWVARQLISQAYYDQCCLSYGTVACATCPLADRIPRNDCNPPNECPTCAMRALCPCGNRALRARLLKESKAT